MRNAYIESLTKLAKDDKRVLALVADNGIIVYDKFRQECPGQFVNFGIAEATMVGAAAGMASCGKIPFVYTIIPFLTMRAYEQIRNDICLQNTNVKLVGIGAGFSYSTLGPTHHGTEDISIMRVLPNMSIISPATPLEAVEATFAAAKIQGPVYIRLGNYKDHDFYNDNNYKFEFGRALKIAEGNDATIIATGSMASEALMAGVELRKEGIKVRILNMHTIKPLDHQAILDAARDTGAILSLEEHSICGGLGGAIAESLLENYRGSVIFRRMGLHSTFGAGYGTYSSLRSDNKLDKESIKFQIRQIIEERNNL